MADEVSGREVTGNDVKTLASKIGGVRISNRRFGVYDLSSINGLSGDGARVVYSHLLRVHSFIFGQDYEGSVV